MVAAIRSKFSGLQSDICLVTNQIDDGLKGNYASNVPEDEYSLPAAEQKKRQDERRAKSETYIPKLKQSFSEANDGAQLIECFADMSDEQYAYLGAKRDELSSAVDATESNFKALLGDFNNLRGEVSDKQIAIFYNTLAYNDKYIKMLVQQMSKSPESFVDFDPSKVDVIGSKEGFADSAEGEVLDFRVAKSGAMGGGKKGGRDPTTEPAHRIEVMEAQLVDLEKTLQDLGKAVQVFVNTTKMQSNKLKKTKAITTDANLQKSKLNAQAGKVTAK
jgi:chromosome segregation ATPase